MGTEGEEPIPSAAVSAASAHAPKKRKRNHSPEPLPARPEYSAAGIAMARLNHDGTVIDVNPAFTRLLDFESIDVASRRLLDLLHPDDSRHKDRSTRYQAGAVRGELRFARKDGGAVWARLTITSAADAFDDHGFLVATLEDITEVKAAEAAMEYDVLHDPATGLPNNPLLMDRLSHAIRGAERKRAKLGVVVIDVDSLERGATSNINDHVAAIARRLQLAVRSSDTIARTGEHELTILVTELGEGDLDGIVAKLLSAADSRFRQGSAPRSIAGVIGTALYPEHGDEAHELLRTAQVTLYLGGHALPNVPLRDEDLLAEPVTTEADLRFRTLESVALFSSVSDQVIRRIARYMSIQTAEAGQELTGPNSSGGLYIVESGSCEMVLDGHEQASLITLGPSDFVAPAAMPDDLRVRLRAATDVRLLVMHQDAVDEHAPKGSPLHRAISKAASQRESQLRGLMARTSWQVGGKGATKIALYSTKGGSGRTTLALNLAADLASRHPGEVLVIDLSLPFNHIALLANLSPSSCLARASSFYSTSQPFGWSAVLPHPAGFMVLPTALRPEESELINPELLKKAVESLSPHFKYIVFDLGSALDENVLTALELSDQIVLLAMPELAAMHDTRRMLELVTRVLQTPNSRVHITLTHRSPASTMSRTDVERIVERKLAAEFVYHGNRSEEVGIGGQLLVQAEPKGTYSRSVAELSKVLRPAALIKRAASR